MLMTVLAAMPRHLARFLSASILGCQSVINFEEERGKGQCLAFSLRRME
jgi:hypothetical protein